MPRWNKLTDEEKKRIDELYMQDTYTIEQIASILNRASITVLRYIQENYSLEERYQHKRINYAKSKTGDKNPMLGKYKEQHPCYKGTLNCPSSRGYQLVLKPKWYSSRVRAKHVFKHHVVVCLRLGLDCIPAGYVVHHCDGDKSNNVFFNLVLLTNAAHTKLHAYLKRLKGATTISKESTLKWVEAHGGGVWHR
ncbi:HNH endonuclease [Selenomonas ruminantium]|uniref:HNH endonuclease n=1 Tax=Selenomonas ruminantium TaxID=971 RepID=UPI0026F069BB|nr:HNH endonuclease [Selenomonas ruminantium]